MSGRTWYVTFNRKIIIALNNVLNAWNIPYIKYCKNIYCAYEEFGTVERRLRSGCP